MYQFKFADIGEGIHEGQVLKWMFKLGDEVKEGETLCIIETDKVNAEIPSPVDGTIKDIKADVGETIHVGEVLVVIDDGSEEEQKKEVVSEDEESSAGVVGELEVSSDVIETLEEEDEEEAQVKALATPVARKMAKDFGLDINKIKGSGPMGRVLKEDVYKAREHKEEPREAVKTTEFPHDVERVPLSKLRKTIAKNMKMSKTIIPHAATMDEYDVTKLVAFRKEQKALALQQDVNLTYMPFIIKAVTQAIKAYPVFNSSFDDEYEEIVLKKAINIGIAVDTPEGLIVPVIKNADQKSILTIAKELQTLAQKAKDRTLALDDLQGGTISITNYGALGQSFGVPVIKHPEVAIVGVGKIVKKPVVVDNEIVIRDILPISLSFDHRVIDGGDAGRFLNKLRDFLNEPMLLLLN